MLRQRFEARRNGGPQHLPEVARLLGVRELHLLEEQPPGFAIGFDLPLMTLGQLVRLQRIPQSVAGYAAADLLQRAVGPMDFSLDGGKLRLGPIC